MERRHWLIDEYIAVLSFILLWAMPSGSLLGQAVWDNGTYPNEFGFQKRVAPMLERIAAPDFGRRSLATSRCPDTGLPVRTWAVEGDTIISPYTGRAYVQGPTGYFGPKARNRRGEITAFGGDPLKYDLPPATATLLLQPEDERAKGFLSIPGNLRQQYHFACKNWARFYPLLAEDMGQAWQGAFQRAVANYEEARRPSDGAREWAPMSHPHNLVGQPGHLLGGNTLDGGTENHKTMWRTSCLVYAQLFPDTADISGHPVGEARELCTEMIRDYLQRILYTGNGEYDSQIYYPHSIEPFLNLYDFSTDPEIKTLAKFALDYYLASYALKVVDGAIAGGQKRGYIPNAEVGEMETLLWAFANRTSRDMSDVVTTIQQATTTYRPNRVIYNLLRQEVAKPYEMRMSRPFYHMDRYNAFQESFYRSESFGLGNVYMSIVDNPNQQIVWSLIAEGTDGPLALSGGQPYPQGTTGHSPYTQTLQHRGTLVLLTAPTQSDAEADRDFIVDGRRMNPWHLPDSAQVPDYERANRQRYAAAPLEIVPRPEPTVEAIEAFWSAKTQAAASWLWIPRGAEQRWMDGRLLLRLNRTLVAVMPLSDDHFVLKLPRGGAEALRNRNLRRMLSHYELLVVNGDISGYVIEAVEAGEYASLEAFGRALADKGRLDTSQLPSHLKVDYRNIAGDELSLQYNPAGLKGTGSVNGQVLDFGNWNRGAVYDSPYLKVKEGVMKLSDGREGYVVDFSDEMPVWRE